jgi:hypothetical protein
MKFVLTLCLLLASNFIFGQSFSYRKSTEATGIRLAIPVNTHTKGDVSLILTKEGDRNLAYIHYIENLNVFKGFDLYGGAGIHLGTRYIMNWKQDGNTIFLLGGTLILGAKYTIGKTVFIAADITPRVDLPLFGDCYLHRNCGQQYVGNVNFSIGINLK